MTTPVVQVVLIRVRQKHSARLELHRYIIIFVFGFASSGMCIRIPFEPTYRRAEITK